ICSSVFEACGCRSRGHAECPLTSSSTIRRFARWRGCGRRRWGSCTESRELGRARPRTWERRSWLLYVVRRKAAGSWLLAVGGWLLAVGFWLLAPGFLVHRI